MANKKGSQLGKQVLNIVLMAGGIYLVILGVLMSELQGWRPLLMALGFVLIITGTIGFSTIKKS